MTRFSQLDRGSDAAGAKASSHLAVGALFCLSFLAGCGADTKLAPLFDRESVGSPNTPLIPRDKIFDRATRTQERLSPDGRWLSWIAPSGGIRNVWIAPVSQPDQARLLTAERSRPVAGYQWSSDSSKLLFFTDEGGNENYVLHSLELANGTKRTLTPLTGVQAQILALSRSSPDRILVTLNRRDPRWHDVYELNLRSGKLELLFENSGYSWLIPDRNLTVRVVAKARDDGGFDYFRVRNWAVEAQPFEQVDLEDSRATEPLSFSEDGRTLYWLDSRGRDTAALIEQDFFSGSKTVIGESSLADIEEVNTNPVTGAIDAYAVDYLTKEWIVPSGQTQVDHAYLKNQLGGQLSIVSRDATGNLWLINQDTVSQPVSVYLYERATKRITKLFSRRPELEGLRLAPMHPIKIRSRDGLTLVSYLTLPLDVDQNLDGKPDKPVPIVLLVHGGPWDRDRYGYNGVHQWLANRGYAALSVNFRGSTGFGKKFTSAGDLQWGARMQDDLLDASNWAVRQGLDQNKIGIFGGSYGGYATLVGLTRDPERFACGVDQFGPSNLITQIEALPSHWGWRRLQFYNRVGNPTTAQGRAFLQSRSPLFSASKIRKPLLIAQGANDPRVRKAESDQIVQALRSKGVPVTYIVFPDEGHGYSKPENNLAFFAIAEQFLGRCLGGRTEPIGDAIQSSNVEVPVGAAFIPGLDPALSAKRAAQDK